MGIEDYDFCNLPCGRFDQVPIIEINKVIEAKLQLFKPDTVLTHSGVDANNDHKITFKATVMATRPCNSHVVKQLLCYEVLSSTEWAFMETFSPNYFVSVTEEQLEIKWRALQCYVTEMRKAPFPRSREGVENLARHRGFQSGVPYAEAFRLIRRIDD